MSCAVRGTQSLRKNQRPATRFASTSVVTRSATSSSVSGEDTRCSVRRPKDSAGFQQAVAHFAQDTDPGGRIPVPVLTVHATGDPVAFVELESTFRDTLRRAGRDNALVQTFTRHREHSYLADPVYPTLLEALLDWVEKDRKPTPERMAERCRELEARWGPGCGFLPGYAVAPLEERVPARERP